MSATSTGSEGSEPKESLAEIRARALRESAERRKQKVEEAQAAQTAPPPTPAAQPVPSRQVQQQETVAVPQPQQQQMTLQQAHDIGLQKGQQQSMMSGIIAGVIICGGAFILYKGACWMVAAPPAARAVAARRVAEAVQ